MKNTNLFKVEAARKLYMDVLWGDPADQSMDNNLNNDGFKFREVSATERNRERVRNTICVLKNL